jgi:SAM-dependent methyltransferase
MKFIFKKIINQERRRWLRFRLIQIRGLVDHGMKHRCNICGKHANRFADFNGKKNRLCPKCFSLERHRLLFDFLQRKTSLFTQENSLLHFAPEKCLHDKLKKNQMLNYETIDLMTHFIKLIEVEPKHIASVTDIPFPDHSFDSVICNHVLEHVEEDSLAMQEIFRVLKLGGFAILQVPINWHQTETLENPDLSREQRRIQYGSPDHVRFYSETDYVSRLFKAGFKVEIVKHDTSLDPETYILDRQENLYVCQK